MMLVGENGDCCESTGNTEKPLPLNYSDLEREYLETMDELPLNHITKQSSKHKERVQVKYATNIVKVNVFTRIILVTI